MENLFFGNDVHRELLRKKISGQEEEKSCLDASVLPPFHASHTKQPILEERLWPQARPWISSKWLKMAAPEQKLTSRFCDQKCMLQRLMDLLMQKKPFLNYILFVVNLSR